MSLIYKKAAGSPEYKPNQDNLTKTNRGKRIGEADL